MESNNQYGIVKHLIGSFGKLFGRRNGERAFDANDQRRLRAKWTETQRMYGERWKQATAWLRLAMADPELRSYYRDAARIAGKPLMYMPVQDFMNPPKITLVDVSKYGGSPGDLIAVVASDDTGVASVEIELSELDGSAIEGGAMTEHRSGIWFYKAQLPMPGRSILRLVVTARDRPGGSDTFEAEVEI